MRQTMSLHRPFSISAFALLGLLLLLGGCSHFQGGSTTTPSTNVSGIAQETVNTVPLGQIAGTPQGAVAALSTPNPFEGNPQAVQQGRELFIRMNCAGCHGYNAKGNMGPDLTDAYWRYGGLPVQIYKTLVDGRPNGMPAWGAALPPDDIWKLVAYIQSLGGAVPVANYEQARQGDHSDDQVAPEAQAEAQLAPVPVRISPNLSAAHPTPSSAEKPARPASPAPQKPGEQQQ